MRNWLLITVWFVGALVPLRAQQRPLQTDEPDPIAVGRVRVGIGIEFLQGERFTLPGLKGDLTRAGVANVQVGVGEFAEFQLSGVLQNFLSVSERTPPLIPSTFSGNSTNDFGDLILASKFKLAGEKGKRPAIGFKFAVQLPNASNETGLGTDETEFYASLLFSKRVARARLLGNLGLAILGSPVQPNSQADQLTYGFGIILPMRRNLDLLGDVNGRQGPERAGNESRSQARLGVRLRAAGLLWDVAGIAGLGKYDANSGVTVGVTFDFQAFHRKRGPRTVR